jgi:hypothetical protein
MNRLHQMIRRVSPFYDPSAWILIIVCGGGVMLFDPVTVKTITQWTLNFGIFAGVAVIISRLIFPQIDLSAHVRAAHDGNIGSGLVVLSVALVMAFLLLSLTLWGKG